MQGFQYVIHPAHIVDSIMYIMFVALPWVVVCKDVAVSIDYISKFIHVAYRHSECKAVFDMHNTVKLHCV